MQIFDIDNPVWSRISKIWDAIVLNFLFVICCIPIITIPASITALNFTAMRFVSGNMSYVSKDFFDSFKNNFKQSFVAGIMVFDAGVIAAVFTWLSYAVDAYVGKVVMVVLDVFLAAGVTYVFPQLAKFTINNKNLFRNSFLMAVSYLPFTFLNLGVLFIMGVGIYYSWSARIILLAFGFSCVAMVEALWFNYIFGKHMTDEEQEIEKIYRDEEKAAKKEKKAEEMKR